MKFISTLLLVLNLSISSSYAKNQAERAIQAMKTSDINFTPQSFEKVKNSTTNFYSRKAIIEILKHPQSWIWFLQGDLSTVLPIKNLHQYKIVLHAINEFEQIFLHTTYAYNLGYWPNFYMHKILPDLYNHASNNAHIKLFEKLLSRLQNQPSAFSIVEMAQSDSRWIAANVNLKLIKNIYQVNVIAYLLEHKNQITNPKLVLEHISLVRHDAYEKLLISYLEEHQQTKAELNGLLNQLKTEVQSNSCLEELLLLAARERH